MHLPFMNIESSRSNIGTEHIQIDRESLSEERIFDADIFSELVILASIEEKESRACCNINKKNNPPCALSRRNIDFHKVS